MHVVPNAEVASPPAGGQALRDQLAFVSISSRGRKPTVLRVIGVRLLMDGHAASWSMPGRAQQTLGRGPARHIVPLG